MGPEEVELQTARRGLVALYDFGSMSLESKISFSKAGWHSWGPLWSFVFQTVTSSLCSLRTLSP